MHSIAEVTQPTLIDFTDMILNDGAQTILATGHIAATEPVRMSTSYGASVITFEKTGDKEWTVTANAQRDVFDTSAKAMTQWWKQCSYHGGWHARMEGIAIDADPFTNFDWRQGWRDDDAHEYDDNNRHMFCQDEWQPVGTVDVYMDDDEVRYGTDYRPVFGEGTDWCG